MEKNKIDLINALIEKPSTYEWEVLDNSMLPKKLKSRKTITFIVKPPTLETLSKWSAIVLRIPKDVRKRDPKELELEDIVEYRQEMAECISVLSHGSSPGEYPNWYVQFILFNLTPKELYILFYETNLKMQTDFFLNSFQSAKGRNPMTMNKLKK